MAGVIVFGPVPANGWCHGFSGHFLEMVGVIVVGPFPANGWCHSFWAILEMAGVIVVRAISWTPPDGS